MPFADGGICVFDSAEADVSTTRYSKTCDESSGVVSAGATKPKDEFGDELR